MELNEQKKKKKTMYNFPKYFTGPEILKDKGYEGFEADIWSAGVALYAMLYGTVPFKANEMKDLHKLIMKGKYNLKEGISIEAKDLLRRMLECNPYDRITIPEILEHAWMKDVDESLSLFTKEEKEKFTNEYNYGADRVKKTDETNTLFTEQNIDSTQDELNKNETTKSQILAPFNSSQSDQDSSFEYLSNDFELLVKKDMIKFAAKVRDIDRQYEKNNNGDVDNGVYNKFVCDSSEDNNPGSSISSISFEDTHNDSLRDFARLEQYRETQFAECVTSNVLSDVVIGSVIFKYR